MIGIFDSGLGGLTVVKEISRRFPKYPIIYFGDTANLPYGTKSKKAVVGYSISAVSFLKSRGAKIIISACNTASALAVSDLKKRFKDTLIFDVISPVIDSFKSAGPQKIGVVGTFATINSGIFQKEAKKANSGLKIYAKACPLFVPLAEEGITKGTIAKEVLKLYLSPLKKQKVNGLVLACTHYPLFEKEIKKFMGPDVKIINPANLLTDSLEKFLRGKSIKVSRFSKKREFFVSDAPYKFKSFSKSILKKDINVKLVNIKKF